jgi:predicted carbohydrate-binding protein with CBM5 and CBM33 domain
MGHVIESFKPIQITKVSFDPTNPQHIDAFEMLVIGVADKDGAIRYRQHPTLRFKIELPFVDVRSMMMERVAKAYVDMVRNK